MFYKVKQVEAINDYNLIVTFENGIIKQYDVRPLFNKWEIFKSLRYIDKLFNQVKVDCGGYGISWNNNIDLSCEELWANGIEVKKQKCI